MHRHRISSDEPPAAYEDAVSFLFSALPMYQRVGKAAYKADLENTLRLDAFFGHPHRKFRSVHVAGTNGKGSVSHMLAAVFQKAGYRTGLCTSPHLLDFRERIRINGEPVPPGEVVGFVGRIKREIEKIRPSFFEMTVAMAFDYFARENVEIALIETGLGGRLDSTNIITPELSVITNISPDHTEFLGNSIESIAREKAGIIKERIPVVIGTASPDIASLFRSVAGQKEAPVHMSEQTYTPLDSTTGPDSITGPDSTTGLDPTAGLDSTTGPDQLVIWRLRHQPTGAVREIRTDLAGHYQGENLATSLTAIERMREQGWDLSRETVEEALRQVTALTGLLGRWQTLGRQPRVICDTAHNAAGVEAVVRQMLQVPCRQLHIVWGMVGDKDPDVILPLLPVHAHYYFTRSSVARSMPEDRLLGEAARNGLKGRSFPTVAEACRAALDNASADDFIFAGGSTFVVADLLGSGIF